ncbi:MAG: hypothetical protein ACPG8W_13480 [Candidatus Promineifilaceae bacterium]
MTRRTNTIIYLCLLVVVVILAASTVSAQDTIQMQQIAEDATSSAPTAIVVQALEVERSPLEWALVLQGAVLLFLFTLLTLNHSVRDHVLKHVRVRVYDPGRL